MEFTTEVKKATNSIYQKISKAVPEIEWSTHAPYIYKINNSTLIHFTEFNRLSLDEIYLNTALEDSRISHAPLRPIDSNQLVLGSIVQIEKRRFL